VLAAAAAGDARFDAALKLAAPPLLQHLRATPLGGWSDGDARALAALSLPAELLAALRAGGCLGAAQLAGPEGLLSWPPLGYELSQPSGQFAPARLLSWACQAGCPAAATFVIELAQRASPDDHGSLLAWAALHQALPPLKQRRGLGASSAAAPPGAPQLLLQCGARHNTADAAEEEDGAAAAVSAETAAAWESVRSRAAGIIAARLVTITPASWTPTDLVNWLLAAGQEALAAAALADGIGGADAAVFGIQPMMMFDPQSKARELPMGVAPAELLQWAVSEGKWATATLLLRDYCDVAQPAWGHGTSGGPSPFLVAQEHNLTAAAAVLGQRVEARLAATPLPEWTEIDVDNWLRGNELPHLAEPFKDDWIRGSALASLAVSVVGTEEAATGAEGGRLPRLAALLRSVAADARKNAVLLAWALQHNHCNILSASLRMMPTTAGDLLLEEQSEQQSLVDRSMWSRACGTSRRVMLNMAAAHLAKLPLASWGGREAAALLYRRNRVEWSAAFAEDGVTGDHLASWPGLPAGESPNMLEVEMGAPSTLQWALAGGHLAVARAVLRSDPDVMLGELPDGDTALSVLLARRAALPAAAAEAESLVRQRQGELPSDSWTVADVANFLLLSGHTEAYGIATSTRMNGATFHGLVDKKGMDALLDPVAMASWAVEAGEAPMLAAVLPVAAEAAAESFASELLLTAAWSGDLECSEILLKHGADINWQNANRYTSLMRAALRGHGHMVSLLLRAGADPSLRSARGKTAAELAASKGHGEIAELITRGGKRSRHPRM